MWLAVVVVADSTRGRKPRRGGRDDWMGPKVTRLREMWRQRLPLRCRRCGQMVVPTDEWQIGHIKSRKAYPELMWELSNMWPEHRYCGESSANDAKAEYKERFSGATPSINSAAPGPYLSPHQETLAPVFDPASIDDVPWLASLKPLPADAAWPRFMTPPHPNAVGTYGMQIEKWAKKEFGVELRWWQRLAVRRQFEHDENGKLCWQTILESTPRRAGKSVRLRIGALWRVEHGAQLFGEEQLVMHTGKDLPIAKEIHRRAWPWADQKGWTVRRGQGNEELEAHDGSRWVVRGRFSIYGYDVTYGMVDEGWGVEAAAVDEGLEPSLLERLCPQLLLTSTAHRKATPLMLRRIDSALRGMGEDWETLLMLWGADPKAPMAEESTWRSASPHWSEHRRKLIAGKYERAMRGEADPDAADPDPIEGFRAQYLNIWPAPFVRAIPGDEVVKADEWESLRADIGLTGPVVAACESSFGDGLSLALAGMRDGRVHVEVEAHPDIRSVAVRLADVRPVQLLAGKSLVSEIELTAAEPMASTGRQAVSELRRLIDEKAFTHDDSGEFTRQALDLRTETGPDGPRLISRGRLDGIKATVWAIGGARLLGETPAIF